MKRFIVLHPQAAMDASMLILTGLALLGAKMLLKFASSEERLAMNYGDDEE